MKLKIQLLAFVCLLFVAFPSFCQQENDFKGTIVYAELLGFSAGGYTINVEKALFHLGPRIGFVHVGAGGFPFPDRDYWRYAIPAGVSLVKGKGNNHTEFGFSLAYAEGVVEHKVMAGSTQEINYSKAIYFIPNFGYRFQKPQRGFFLRVTYNPMFTLKEFTDNADIKMHSRYPINFGVSLGYSFSKSQKDTQ